ncbi:MAG: HTH domain-containing protein [Lachnospiraceae bacterium]|jgi:predicted DNA-binding transcriptional regulator YafY|nr:HTH domain-containing protein [Lachnospiraceae bacterium]MCX4338211.1 HTH domain-containing protein [Lachnospiraceae bacterium]
MNTNDRRTEIMNILIIRRRTTARELAEEFGVTTRTIERDIQALSPGYPIYTKQGGDGGIFIGEDYKPYINTLSSDELDTLCEIYRQAKDIHKKILLQIISKYGPDKLSL